ncbi:MAG: SDR family NAD(P)-dependent oxidoreductase, partial [Variovorax sp.]
MDLGAMLKGQRVLVTGASSGLGAHFARLAATCGAHVVIAARRKDKLEHLARELASLGAQSVTSLQLDVADEASVTAAFDAFAAADSPLDVVVNNAGISGDGLAIDQPIAEFDAVMGTN